MTARPLQHRRIVYFGTPEFAVAPMRALLEAGGDIALVVTSPPKRRGRRQAPSPSPVAAAADDMGLTVTSVLEDAAAPEADLAVVVAYGHYIPEEVLARRRTVNLHFSRLPRWRGAAPVERAILAGDTETGVCLIEVAAEIDTGGIYRRASTPIGAHETAAQLRARLCDLGIELLLDAMAGGFGPAVPQTGAMTWADKITPADLRIDWSASAEHALRQVRVGGAWTLCRGRRLKILAARSAPTAAAAGPTPSAAVGGPEATEPQRHPHGGPDAGQAPRGVGVMTPDRRLGAVVVAAGRGAVALTTVQAEGRAPTAALAWYNGVRVAHDERLGL